MAILVTGGAGYIGSHMAWALFERGQEVILGPPGTTIFSGVLRFPRRHPALDEAVERSLSSRS
jgi:nucleoside-diphosphate-sugar epimerase